MPCYFLLLPAELRVVVYRLVFEGFMLQISGESTCAPYDADPQTAQNQLCRTNTQIRVESIPVLTSSTKVITAPVLLPQKDGRVDRSVKPVIVCPKLHLSFLLNIENISVSLQSAWVPHHSSFPRLKKIAIDAWLYNDAPTNRKKADKDLIERTTTDLADLAIAEDIYPRWLWDLNEQCKPRGVKLAVQQVWMLDEENSDTSYLVSLQAS